MLEIVVFKTAHRGKTEAKKLIPHIKECDVFSLEATCVSEQEARENEGRSSKSMDSKMSRLAFLKALKPNLEFAVPDTESRKYVEQAMDYLFSLKVPLYMAERWQDIGEANETMETYSLGNEKFVLGINMIAQGEETKGIALCYEGSLAQIESIRKRDQNVANNLNRAEEIIRETYAKLADKPKINAARGALIFITSQRIFHTFCRSEFCAVFVKPKTILSPDLST